MVKWLTGFVSSGYSDYAFLYGDAGYTGLFVQHKNEKYVLVQPRYHGTAYNAEQRDCIIGQFATQAEAKLAAEMIYFSGGAG